MSKLKSIDDIKKKFGIKSFDNITNDQSAELLGSWSKFSPDLQHELLNKIPIEADFFKIMVLGLQAALEKVDKSQMATIHAHQTVLDSLRENLSKDYISESERADIRNKLIAETKEIRAINTEHKLFIGGLVVLGLGAVVKLFSEYQKNKKT